LIEKAIQKVKGEIQQKIDHWNGRRKQAELNGEEFNEDLNIFDDEDSD